MAPGDVFRRAQLLRAAGATVRVASTVQIGAVTMPRLEVDARDNAHAIAMFDALARDDGRHDPEIRRIAGEIAARAGARGGPRAVVELTIARMIHAYVLRRVVFQPEAIETNRGSALTLRLGLGDCDDHAGLVVALATAAGLRARVHGLVNRDGLISHAVAIVTAGGKEYWCETTIPAHFGEHPQVAAARVAKGRRDITG